MLRILYFISAFLIALPSYAGLMELSYSLSLSDSSFNENTYTKTVSNTASFAWYFLEMSAIEISYSKGEQEFSSPTDTSSSAYVYRIDFEMYGADLVLAFGGKDAVFQPYIKGGAAWVEKQYYRLPSPGAPEKILLSEVEGDDPVPSMGVGFKFMLFKNLRLKASYDRWRSGKDDNGETWDSRTNAGISLYF